MRCYFLLMLFLFSGIVRLTAQSEEEYFIEAQNKYQKGDYAACISIINKAIQKNPDVPQYYDLKGDALVKSEKYQDAFDCFSLAIQKFPNYWAPYYSRGQILAATMDFDLAIRDFTTAYDLAPGEEEKESCLVHKATSLTGKRDFKPAYDILIAMYKKDTTNLVALTNLGAICDEIGKPEETMFFLLKAIEVDSTFYPALGNIGYKYQNMGQYEKAIFYYNKILALNPNEPLGYSNRAFNLYKLGRLDEAMSDINRSIELYPANSYAYRVRGLIWLEKKKKKKACEDFQMAIDGGFTKMYGDEVEKLMREHCK